MYLLNVHRHTDSYLGRKLFSDKKNHRFCKNSGGTCRNVMEQNKVPVLVGSKTEVTETGICNLAIEDFDEKDS